MTSFRHLVLQFLCAAVVSAQGAADPGFRVYLWLQGGPTPTAASLAAIREVGFTGVNAEGAADVERIGPLGFPFYVDHAVPKGFLHIRPETFETAREAWRRDPKPEGLSRPTCLRDPAELKRAEAALRATIDACRKYRPDFISLTDEPSATRGVNPIDWCRDDRCRSALPAFLGERWGGEPRAREAWGDHWPKGGLPNQVLTEDVRRAIFHGIGPSTLLAAWHDTRCFTDQAFVDAATGLAAIARKELPGIQVGLLGVDMPSGFGGFDWEQLAPALDAFEPYDFGAARRLIEGCARRDTRFLHTYFPAGHDVATLSSELWHYFLQGDRGAIFFSSKDWFQGGDPAKPGPLLSAVAPLLKTLGGDELAAWRRARPIRAQVAILHSMPSTRLHWLLDTRHDGGTWFNRLTSYEQTNSSEAVNREAWASLLSDVGLSWRFVSTMDLRNGALHQDGYSMLVLPATLALSDADVRAIDAFAPGHLVIADRDLGLFTHRLERRAKPALDDLFGISRAAPADLATLGDFTVDRGLPLTPHERGIKENGSVAATTLDEVPVLFARGSTGTRTLYMNLRIGGYLQDRIAAPDRAARLRDWIRPYLLSSAIRPRVDLRTLQGSPAWPVVAYVRSEGEDILLALELNVRTGSVAIDWKQIERDPTTRVEVTFPGTFGVSDLLSGGQLGILNRIEVPVSLSKPRLLRLNHR